MPESLATSRQFCRQGIAALERQRWEQAESLLAKAVEACPVDVDARRNYAEALWHRGARKEALAQLEETVELAGDDASLRVRIAELELEAGQVDAARRSAEQALDLNPNLPAAWAVRGKVMQASGDLQRALADYHRGLTAAPNDEAMLLAIAELYRQMDQPQRALATLHRLIDTYAPGEEPQQVLYLQGLAYLALGRPGEARQSLAAAGNRAPPTAEIIYHRAEAEWATGRRAEAAATAKEALALDPQHGPSRDLLVRMGRLDEPARVMQR